MTAPITKLNVAEHLFIDGRAPCVARFIGFDACGRTVVEIAGVPTQARVVAGIDLTEDDTSDKREVLVVFDGGDTRKPIIVALMRRSGIEEQVDFRSPKAEPQPPSQAVVDGKSVVIEGRDEVVLKCGEGSITLRKDGRIVIKGTHLLSRSTGPHRIKGGSVSIN